MGVQKKTRKFAATKRVIGQRDARLKKNIMANEKKDEKKAKDDGLVREMYVLIISACYSLAIPHTDMLYTARKFPPPCSSTTTPPSSHPTRFS